MTESVDELQWVLIGGNTKAPGKEIMKKVPPGLKGNMTLSEAYNFLIRRDVELDDEGKKVAESIESAIAEVDAAKKRNPAKPDKVISFKINNKPVKGCDVKDGKLQVPQEDIRNYGTVDTYEGKRYYKLKMLIDSVDGGGYRIF